ncbi:unnamed protein product [Ranitomeya imitator]|uniref:Uncharacterized protein n=1 Tax=Ranitomeya imitator TaxID=111125 RepID=A0ABN9LB26_9NEOB|nr:unnamed protein product [Ranitomeya imitator]
MLEEPEILSLKCVDRTPYQGDVAVVVNAGKKETGSPMADTPTRPSTRHGGMRDLHESGFSLSVTAMSVLCVWECPTSVWMDGTVVFLLDSDMQWFFYSGSSRSSHIRHIIF